MPKPGKGRDRGEKLDSVIPAFFLKEVAVNLVLKHLKDWVESELRAASGLGKLLSQKKQLFACRVSLMNLWRHLRGPARTRPCGTSAVLSTKPVLEMQHLCLPLAKASGR